MTSLKNTKIGEPEKLYFNVYNMHVYKHKLSIKKNWILKFVETTFFS